MLRIFFHLEHEAVHLVLALQLLLALLRILVHGAELIDLEEAAVLSHTLLCENSGPGDSIRSGGAKNTVTTAVIARPTIAPAISISRFTNSIFQS